MLAEIHEEMIELLDKQMNVQNESLKKTSGVHTSSCKPTKQCAMKVKKERKEERKKKRLLRKNFCGERTLTEEITKEGIL